MILSRKESMAVRVPSSWRKIIPSHDVRPAAPYGADITPGTNAYGSYVEVLSGAQLTHDVWELLIRFHDIDSSAVAMDMIARVGFDPAGGSSYTDIIDHLICTYAASYTAGGQVGVEYKFKLHIPAGSSIAVKASANNATPIHLRCSMIAFCDPSKPWTLWKGTFVRTFGANTAASCGTAVTSGTAAEGTYTLLGTLADTIYEWQTGMGVNDATIATGNCYHMDLGVDTAGNGVQRDVVLNQRQNFTTAESASRSLMVGMFKGVSGDKVYGRLQCSTTADSSLTMIAYGVGGTWQPTGSASFTVAGTVEINNANVADGKTVKIYAVDSDDDTELVTTTTTSGGAFSVDVWENTRSYFASYENDGKFGRSASGTPEISSFNIAMFTSGPAGGGGGASAARVINNA